jgi:hypothetical protein
MNNHRDTEDEYDKSYRAYPSRSEHRLDDNSDSVVCT